jgi:hypothetical protein
MFFEQQSYGCCTIQRRAGAAALPSACRHFPREVLVDARGTFISLSHFCPTAAAMLFGPSSFDVVAARPPLLIDPPLEGMDAVDALAPLVRPGLLSDLEGYAAWERACLDTLAQDDCPPWSALDLIARATDDIREWRPDEGPLAERVRSAFARTGPEPVESFTRFPLHCAPHFPPSSGPVPDAARVWDHLVAPGMGEYEPARDFVLVAPLATMPFVLMVNAGVPVDSTPSLAAWLKARPGEINFGSSGDGSVGHLAGELFRRTAGVNVVHVSYNGGLAALNGLATGQVSLMFAALPLALPYLTNEYLRPLGLASPRRFELLPGLATLAESGLPGFEVEAWFGVFAPARTPAAAAAWLRERIAGYTATDAAKFRLQELGLNSTKTLAQFATRLHSETEKWAPVLRASRMPLKGKDEG